MEPGDWPALPGSRDQARESSGPRHQSPLSPGGGLWTVHHCHTCGAVGDLLEHQKFFYREAYADPTFTIDHTKLGLPRERLDAWKDALARGEADYPLVVAPPQNLTNEERGLSPSSAHTLHRVLFDRLIRAKGITVWERTDPDLNTFLDQVRDLTLEDLTRTDLLGPDGKPLRFERNPELDQSPNTLPV